MNPTHLDHVVCLFHWQGVDWHEPWQLSESYAADADGRVLTPVRHADASSRQPWHAWLYQSHPDRDSSEIMGRAVVCWCFDRGVVLMGLHPPAWCDWLSRCFVSELRKQPEWWFLIAGGSLLCERCVGEVRHLLEGGGR